MKELAPRGRQSHLPQKLGLVGRSQSFGAVIPPDRDVRGGIGGRPEAKALFIVNYPSASVLKPIKRLTYQNKGWAHGAISWCLVNLVWHKICP